MAEFAMDGEMESAKLEYINKNEAKTLLPVLVFYVITMLISIVENISVIVVYQVCFKQSPRKIFILSLSLVDLAMCCIGIPYHVLDLRNPYTYTFSATCKILTLLLSSAFLCSSLTLLVVGVDRYLKICRPFKSQMTTRGAKCISVVLMCVSLVLASPQVVLYGYSSIDIANENVTGVQCFFEDQYVGSTLPILYHWLILTIFVATTIILIVLYFKICKTLYMHKRRLSMLKLSKRLRIIQTGQDDFGVSSQLVTVENNDVEILVVLMESEQNVTSAQRNKAELEVLKNKLSDRDTSPLEQKLPNPFDQQSTVLIPVPVEGGTRKALTGVENDLMGNEMHRVDNASEIKQTGRRQNTIEIQNKDNSESYEKDNQTHIGKSDYYKARKYDIELNKLPVDSIKMCGENTPHSDESLAKMDNEERTNSMELHSDSSRDNGNNPGEIGGDYSNSCHRIVRTIIQKCFCFNINPDKHGKQNQMCLSKDQFIMKLLRDKRTLKITYMTFTITAVFIVSYFPSIYIMMTSLLNMNYWENLSTEQTVLHELLIRSYLINNMVNPIIYGFWDEKFRFECLKMIKCFWNRIV